MKEQSKNRIHLIHQRFAKHDAPPGPTREAFAEAFVRVREAVIRPVMEDVAAELRSLGHQPEISIEPVDHEGRICQPAIALRLGLRGAPKRKNHVVLAVIDWKVGGMAVETPEVLAFHAKEETPFDLFRFARPDDVTGDVVEQLLVDSIEALFALNTR